MPPEYARGTPSADRLAHQLRDVVAELAGAHAHRCARQHGEPGSSYPATAMSAEVRLSPKDRRTVRWVCWSIGFAFLASVGAGGPALAADPKPRPAGKVSPKACQANTADLAKWLATYVAGIDSQPAFIALPEQVELASIDRPASAIESGVVVLLSPHDTSVEGEVVAERSDVLVGSIRTALARQQALAKLTRQPLAQTMLLAVDRRATWRRVVQTVHAASVAGAQSVQLAFRSTRVPRVSVPGASAFDQPFEALRQAKDPSERAEAISNMVSALVSTCAPLRKPLTSMAEHGGLVPGAFADAILACDCAADTASLKTLIWSLRPPLPGTLLTLILARDTSQGTPIAADGALAWAAAHELILKAVGQSPARPVRLELRADR
jgi:hypothetical protein